MRKGVHLLLDGRRILLLCFLAGVVLGTLAGNMGMGKALLYGEGMKKSKAAGAGQGSLGPEGLLIQDRPWRRQAGNADKFLYICRQRLGEGAIGWLLGLTICAAPCFWCVAGYMGFSVGWIVSRYTVDRGILGLPQFVLSCFPQWLFYLLAWYLFIWLGFERPMKVRLFPALLAFGLLCLGAGAEAFVNPFFLNLI